MIGVFNSYVVGVASVLSGDIEAIPLGRDRWVYLKAVKIRLYTEYVLGDSYHIPCSCTCQPGVLALTEVLACLADIRACVLTAYHLTVYIRLGLVDIGSLLSECRSDLGIVLECLVAFACISSSADYPSVVVCEYTCVLLISAGVCGDLTVLDIVLGECRVVEYETELGVKSFVDSSKGLHICALLLAYLGHDSKALRLDEYLTLFALLGAHLLAVSVISSEEPAAVPCGLHNVLLHLVDLSLRSSSFVVLAKMLEYRNVVRTCVCEQCSYHYGLSYLGVAALSSELGVGICLEALARSIRIA